MANVDVIIQLSICQTVLYGFALIFMFSYKLLLGIY